MFFGYFNLFFNINGKNLKELSKDHGTVAHLSRVTDQFVREGLIVKEKKEREVELILTEAGEEFLEILQKYHDFATEQLKRVKNDSPKED